MAAHMGRARERFSYLPGAATAAAILVLSLSLSLSLTHTHTHCMSRPADILGITPDHPCAFT